jgi:long-subunit acyl-CoA synthetase (AMP-forming)
VSEILGGQVLTNGLKGDRAQLKEVEERLNADKRVRKAVLAEVRALQGKDVQDFERVAEVYLPLEPFNMANGLLTQTLKIKRNVVADVYAQQIASLYGSSR